MKKWFKKSGNFSYCPAYAESDADNNRCID